MLELLSDETVEAGVIVKPLVTRRLPAKRNLEREQMNWCCGIAAFLLVAVCDAFCHALSQGKRQKSSAHWLKPMNKVGGIYLMILVSFRNTACICEELC